MLSFGYNTPINAESMPPSHHRAEIGSATVLGACLLG